MGYYSVQKDETKAINFFAGTFPIVRESGIAVEAIPEYAPVCEVENGIAVVTADTIGSLIGIASVETEVDEAVVFYMTGEYFADALTVPEGIDIEAIKKEFRKKSIYLK